MPRVSKLRASTQQGNKSDIAITYEDVVEALLDATEHSKSAGAPHVVVSGTGATRLDLSTTMVGGSSADKYKVETDGDIPIESPGLLLEVLRHLGMVHMTTANAEHVFRQIVVSHAASPSSAPPPTVVHAKDILDWIDAIQALNASEAPLGGDDDQPAIVTEAPTAAAQEQALASFVFSTEDFDVEVPRSPKVVAAVSSGGGGLLGVPGAGSGGRATPTASAKQAAATTAVVARVSHEVPLADAAVQSFLQRAIAAASLSTHGLSSDALVAVLEAKGVGDQLVQLLQRAVGGKGTTPRDETVTIHVAAGGASVERAANDAGHHTALERRTLAFASALSLKHVASGSGASMGIVATLMFVDISGYSAVTSALEGLGAHAMSAVVNGYLQKIVRVVRDHGGDVVKFAGDALLALWFEGSDVDNCSSAVRCAVALQVQCGTESIPNTGLSFGLHCGISHGHCRSRIFAPRKLRSNDMPSHFHFLSGEPLTEVGEACSLAERGSTVVHQSVLNTLLEYARNGRIQVAHTDEDYYARIVSVRTDGNETAWPPLVPTPDKSAIAITAAGSATLGSSQQQERCFIPPKVALVLDSGMDQFFMAEMRELVVLFIQFAETTEVEVWFDEVFHILESFGCDVVQIIDDDKGVHIVAALNLYLMAEQSVDAAIGIALSMRAKRCDARVGAAAGTVFCGVLGSAEACQWDISGAACVRAARLMQHAVANDLSACFDGSIFDGALDRSNLKTLAPIAVKGSPEPVPIYALRDSNSDASRGSITQVMEKIPTLAFHQSLCPTVHRQIIVAARTALELPNAEALALAAVLHRRRKSGRLAGEESSALSSNEERKTLSDVGSLSRASSMQSQSKSHATSSQAANNRHETKPRRPRMAVFTGCSGTGKFSTAINVLSESNTIPIVHECYERQSLVQLLVVHTISLWFTYSKIPSVKALADRVLKTFREHRQNEAFGLTLELLMEVCRNAELQEHGRFAIVVRAAQFLDQSSVSFLGAAAKRFEDCNRLVFLVTCSPLYGYPEPEKKFVAFGNVMVYELKSLSDDEASHLFAHTIQQKPDSRLLQFVCAKTNNHVECIVELGKYLRRCAVLNLGADGFARMRLANIDEVERMLWGDISPVIRRKAVHILDHLTPELLTMCKIIAAITEQPLITAFFYSVSKVCESLQRSVLNVDNVKTLDAIWLLRMCEHKCTAHTGTGELDAAVFLVPAMRDIVLAALVPQQRLAINKICGDCYHETHPMDHPMQFLVRARHYLFCSMHALYVRDLTLGWGLILQMTSKDVDVIKGRYYDWMRELDPNEVDGVLHHNPEAIKGFDAYMRKRRLGFASSQRASTRLSTVHNQDTRMLRLMQSLSMSDVYPLELGPARPAYLDVLRMIQLLIETADTGMVSLHAATLEEEGAASMGSVLDQLSAALSGYSMSVTYCLEGHAVSRKVGDAVRNAFVDLKQFVSERLDSEETHRVLCEAPTTGEQPSAVTEARAAHIKSLALGTLDLLDEHIRSAIQPLCATLRDDADTLLDDACRMSVVIRRRVAFTGTCAFAQACRSLRDDASNTERGDLLASLFEHLPTILDVYAPSSERLQRIFCDGLEAFYRGTLQPPETHMRLRGTLAVFWYSWLNCCTQQLLFH